MNIQKTYKKINLRNLSFLSNTDFTLKKLAFDAYIKVNDPFTEITNFELITDRSDIKISRLSAYEFNPFEGNAFTTYMDTKMSLSFNVDRFNFEDLKYFSSCS